LKQLLKSNLTANGKLLRGNSAARIDNARHVDIDEIAGRKIAFGLPSSAVYRGLVVAQNDQHLRGESFSITIGMRAES
jgi:hypothetical protein